MPFERRIRRVVVAGASLTLAALAVTDAGRSQTAPASAPPMSITPTVATDPQLPKKPAAAPAATAAKPATTAPQAAKPATAAKPTAAKPAVVAKPGAPVPPAAVAAAKPGDAKKAAAKPAAGMPPAAVAQKVSPQARRAAAFAAMTAQATPPVHEHVFKPANFACSNPDAIGVERVLEVDTTGGLYVGQTYLNNRLPLEPKEVVLTFDDGPLTRNTERVLEALQAECTRASFFIVGAMAKAHPETLRKIALAGHTIGYHTMTHPLDMVKRPVEWGKENWTAGWRTVDDILYGKSSADRPANSFFRYPGLFNSRGLNAWFNTMDIGVFAIDAAGNDWLKGYLTATDAPNVMNEALKELERNNGGILLLHDIKESSSRAVAPLLRELKTRGFKIVHVVPKRPPPPLADHTVTGAIPASTAPVEPLPVGQRSLAGFDTTQQLIQGDRGFAGKLPGTALPTGTVTATAPLPVAHAPLPVAPAGATTLAAAPAATERSIADVIGSDVGRDLPVVATTAAPADTETSWLAATGRSFRGIASAIGIW